jgi:hypothetical protein
MASKGQMQLKSRSSSSSSADLEERVASLEPMTGTSRAQKVKAIFSQFDKNDDGRLSKDEMAALVVAVNPSVRFSEEQVLPTPAPASPARPFAPLWRGGMMRGTAWHADRGHPGRGVPHVWRVHRQWRPQPGRSASHIRRRRWRR